jgi:predicted DCC family thiol-disulfide oxidoreductase YuxK
MLNGTDADIADLKGRRLIVVMDGDCALCSRGARWIARHDHHRQFAICTSQSALGQSMMQNHGIDPADPESWMLTDGCTVWTSLDAIIQAGQHLGGVSRLFGVFMTLPRPGRDWLYRRIARNRYSLFGRTDMCALPDPELQRRLIR